MSKVILKSMDLHYFKGKKSLQVEFNKEVTEISGPNGSGKSTVADAFTWCLFGKNMKGESDTKFLVKTVDENGVEIPHVNHEVEMVLEVNGEDITMKRILVPEYDKAGNLNGNHTEYFCNDVPKKKSEYDAKVKEIIDESVFKLITSPFAFLTMDWKKQREMLMNMAGDINDVEIASKSQEFTLLLSKLSNKTLDEYRKEISCKLSKVNEEMEKIPVRVDELKRNIPECVTESGLKRKTEIESEIEKIEAEERSIADAMNASHEEALKKVREINDLKQKQFQILNEAESKERMEIHKANTKFLEAESRFKDLEQTEKTDSADCTTMENAIRVSIANHNAVIERNEHKLVDLRNEWMKVNAEEFNAEDHLKCPLYGHPCSDDGACAKFCENTNEAFEKFNSAKSAKLAEISESGKAIKKQNEDIKVLIDGMNEQILKVRSDYESRNADRIKLAGELEAFMKSNPKKPLIASVKGEDLPEWIELGLQIAELESKMSDQIKTSEVDADKKQMKISLMNELDGIKALISNKAIADASNKRIEELEGSLQSLGEEKARLENEKQVADDFEVAKMEEVGAKVNSMFSIVKWQMFTRQVNGEIVPACLALVNGVRWDCANTASMYNAGIDVASSLSRAYQVSAPMFIDNAESIGTIYNPGEGQQIHLRHDKTKDSLHINYV